MEEHNTKPRSIFRTLNQNLVLALVVCASIISSGVSGCQNNGNSAPSRTTSAGTTQATQPTFGGGTLPDGENLTAITLVNAGPSVSSSNGTTLDLIGQSGEIGAYCPTATDCQCRIRWTDPVSSAVLQDNPQLDYAERDLARCSYANVPGTVTQFSVSLLVVDGGAASNEITLTFPNIDSSTDASNVNNFSKAVRYQCKDVISLQSATGYPTGWYDGLEDPQLWNLSYSYNLYSTSLGADYGGAVRGFECPTRVTDASVVKYSTDRYWPDLSGVAGTAGPFGLDARCGTDITLNNCYNASTFDGRAAPWNTSTLEYDPRNNIFGKSGDPSLVGADIDTTSSDDPYDMALFSAKPLSSYDNVIYPVNIDQGAKTTVGVQNGASCLDGTDSDLCTCVSGDEKDCRRFKSNRHDFYLANFYDNSFRQPFCTPHSVGGARGASSLGAALDCTVDASETPITKGVDVLGFAALPNAAGQCPNVELPASKKWGLLWHFRAQLDARQTINITNIADIRDLHCTRRDLECKGSALSTGSCSDLDATCVANQNGPQYCTSVVTAESADWRMGVITGNSDDGQRFGNCLDIAGMTGAIDRGWCSKTDGSAPYFQNGTAAGANALASAVSWDVTAVGGGCYDPMQLYFNNSIWTGLASFLNIPGAGCDAYTDNGNVAFSTSSAHTFDWQGFPFIAGNYSSKTADQPETMRGVGYGGNYCNPALPGNRWTQGQEPHPLWVGSGGTQIAGERIGWNDGLDVWIIGDGSAFPCIEADVSSPNSSTTNITGFLYNPYARVADPAPTTISFNDATFANWLRLRGTAVEEGYPGLVSNFPKTIKNWFDFLGIGCDGKCDNSDSSNSYPPLRDWIAGRSRQASTIGSILENAFRTGPHSSTDSWGGYGVFQFGSTPIESTSREDHLFVVSRQGITMSQMEGDAELRLQYTPVRYIRGSRITYELVSNSSDSSDPTTRLPVFPLCVLQDNGEEDVE